MQTIIHQRHHRRSRDYTKGVYEFTPLIESTFKRRRKPVGNSWRMDETYIKVKGEWMYLYRAVDKNGCSVDFLLTKRRNKYAAHQFLCRAIHNNNCPEVINTLIKVVRIKRLSEGITKGVSYR
jgi:transposase-like protein